MHEVIFQYVNATFVLIKQRDRNVEGTSLLDFSLYFNTSQRRSATPPSSPFFSDHDH